MCIETRANKTVATTNKLATDWASHRESVEKYCAESGARVIAVRDHATIQRLKRFYFRHLIADDTAKTLLAMFTLMTFGFFALVALLRLILR
jgi:hypothetical protein